MAGPTWGPGVDSAQLWGREAQGPGSPLNTLPGKEQDLVWGPSGLVTEQCLKLFPESQHIPSWKGPTRTSQSSSSVNGSHRD